MLEQSFGCFILEQMANFGGANSFSQNIPSLALSLSLCQVVQEFSTAITFSKQYQIPQTDSAMATALSLTLQKPTPN